MGVPLIELSRGQLGKLRGKVLVFTELEGPEPRYPAVSSADDPLDLMDEDNLGDVPDSIRKLQEFYKKHREGPVSIDELMGVLNEMFEQGGEELPPEVIKSLRDISTRVRENQGMMIIPSMLWCNPYPMDSPKEAETFDGDVVYAGKISKMEKATARLMAGLLVYMDFYHAQLDSQFEQLGATSAGEIEFDDYYRNYSPKELRDKLYSMMGELIDAVMKGDQDEEKKIISELKIFTARSPFITDVINLIGLAQTRGQKSIKIIEMIVDKIVAVYDEDYEKASHLKQAIEKIVKG